MTSWSAGQTELTATVVRFSIETNGRPATWADMIDGLQHDRSCRTVLTGCLNSTRFDQIYWETPPVTATTQGRAFEFVAVAARLQQTPSSAPFAEFLGHAKPTATFNNLDGSAVLVAPNDLGDGANHSYLLSFLRTASPEQIDDFWIAVSNTVAARLSDRPVWVSTHGGGVPWLHVRLDDQPKYYTHQPYKSTPA